MTVRAELYKKLGSFELDVQFSLDKGVLGLLGASGSGKSKTLQCLAGIERPDRGCIQLGGRILFDKEQGINMPAQERHVGYLFQNYALFPHMTVEKNIVCGVRNGKDRRQKEAVVREMLRRMQLTGLEKLKPDQLSGGQQQRVALARILVNEPELLLLDEPLSALDSYLKEQVMTELRSLLARFGRPAVLVTHSRDEAYQLCQSIAIMKEGHIDRIGPVKEVFEDPRTRTSAKLTGCKNIVTAEKAGPSLVYVPDWQITFDAKRPVEDGLCAVGIRAHCFHGKLPENGQALRIAEEIEQPFEWIVKFRYARQREDTAAVWWRFAKSDRPERLPDSLGVKGSDILLLYH